MSSSRFVGAALVIAGAVSAQRTIVVDLLMRPGAQFPDIPPALLVAVPGDVIFCRPGDYTAPQTSLGVRIVSPGSRLFGELRVVGLPVTQTFTLSGFHWRSDASLDATFEDCAGLVHVEGLHAFEPPAFGLGRGIRIRRCAGVTLNDCGTFGLPAIQVENSRLLLTRCLLGRTRIGLGGGPCIIASGGELVIVEPQFDSTNSAHPAVTLDACRTWITGSPASFIQGGTRFGNAPAIDVTGPFPLHLDPRVRLNPSSGGQTNPGIPTDLPATLATGAPAGGTATVTVSDRPHAAAAAILGLPNHPLAGTIWIDPSALLTIGTGTLSATGEISFPVPIPSSIQQGAAFAVISATSASGVGTTDVFMVR